MYETILFDLDGTLIDSAEGIMNSFEYTFRKLGMPRVPRGEMGRFIGPPLLYSFETICGLSAAEAAHAVELYREYFSTRGIFEIRVYSGMEELLQKLRAAGKKLVLATSKYELYAAKTLENIGFAGYFDFVAGSEKDGGRGTKVQVIEYAIACTGAEKSSTVMIGDRMHDTEGARAAGVDSIGVLFGFGTRTELEEHGATYVAADAGEIYNIICGG